MAQMLIDQRKKVEGEMRELLDAVEKRGAGSDMTAEETQKFDRLNEQMDSLRSRSDALVKFQADADAAEKALKESARSMSHSLGDATIAEQFRSLMKREISEIEFTPTRSLEKVRDEVRALSKGTATAGGNTVPTDFVNRLYEHLIETATLLRAGATTLNTATGENIDMPVTTSHGTAALVLEGGTIPQSDPAFGKRSLSAYKYGELIIISRELLNDTAVDLDGYLARMAGRAVGNALGAHLVNGTGSSQPAGIVGSTTLGKTGGTGVGGAPTFDDLIDLVYSVIGPYRTSPDAGFLIKDTTAATLRKLKDSSGRYLWESSVTAGVPDRILSYPVLTDPNMPAVGTTAKSVIFGDLSTYIVRLVNNVRFERSDEFLFNTDQVAFRCLIRGDGMLLDQSGAVKHFAGAAT
jgi:HK97 family phage major capsid protein